MYKLIHVVTGLTARSAQDLVDLVDMDGEFLEYIIVLGGSSHLVSGL